MTSTTPPTAVTPAAPAPASIPTGTATPGTATPAPATPVTATPAPATATPATSAPAAPAPAGPGGTVQGAEGTAQSVFDLVQPYLPLIGIALAVLGVVILVLLILHLRKSMQTGQGKRKDPVLPADAASPPQNPPSTAAYASDPPPFIEDEPVRKADHSMTLAQVMGILGNRKYSVPWVALVGAPMAGKTALMASMDLGPDRVDGGPSAINKPGWWMFDNGVVVDVPGSLFLSDTGPRSDAVWQRFVHQIKRARRRRPLNGVILAISSEDLVGLSALSREDLLERGRDLHSRLRSAQVITGLRLPVYVVVTKCDRVSGFTSYWASQPERRRSEMFGWANPNSVDTAYRSEWIEDAFETIGEDLFRGQIAATSELAIGDPRAAGLNQFPGTFATLAEPLQAVMAMIFQPTAYHAAFFLRGVWFTGSIPPMRDLMGGANGPGLAENGADMVPTMDCLPHIAARPILIRHLLTQKVLAERAVARPLAGSWRTDTRTVRRAKIAVAASSVAMGAGLAWSVTHLHHDLHSLTQALNVVREEMDRESGPMYSVENSMERVSQPRGAAPRTVPAETLRQAVDADLKLNAARALLDALGAIRTNDLATPFIPTSWFSEINTDIGAFLARGFEHVVLDAMEVRLAQKAKKIISDPPIASRSSDTHQGRPASLGALTTFMDELDALDKDIQQFNSLGTPAGVSALPDLVHSLMGIDLPPEFTNYPELLQSAMQVGGTRSFPVKQYSGAASERVSQLVWQLLNDLTDKGALAESLRTLAGSLQKLQAGGQDPDGVLLESVRVETNRIADLLGEPWWAVVANGQLSDTGTTSALLVRVGKNSFLGVDVRDRLTADVEGALRRFHSKVTAYSSPLTGPLLSETTPGQVAVSPAVASLAASIEQLFSQSFMQTVPVEVIPQVQGRVEWDRERLDRAVGLWRDYDTYLADGLPQFQRVLRPRVQAVMDRRLVNSLVWNIAHSIKPLPPATDWQGPKENAVAVDVTNLQEALQPLGLLITAFNETGNVVQRDDLSDAVSGGAFDVLKRIDALLSRETLYLPLNDIQQWMGQQPVSAVLFNAPDDVALQQYLSYQRERAHRLAVDYASPVLDALAVADTGRQALNQPLVQNWQRLFQDVDAYYKRRPGSTLVQLESFIRFGLADMRVGNCIDRLNSLAPEESSGDYFLSRRADLRAMVSRRCDQLNGGSGSLGSPYAQLAEHFNATLAGRYPFANSTDGQGLRAATPTDIEAFFATYDALKARVEQDIQRGVMADLQRQQVQTFLAQMDAVRSFVAPLMGAKPGAAPAGYAVAVSFRVNQAFESYGNQILTWKAAIGAQSIQDPPLVPASGAAAAAPATMVWRWGDPISLRLQWAKDSPYQPTAAAGGNPSVEAPSTAVFAYQDPWALVTLLRSHPIVAGQYNPAQVPAPNMLSLAVPTQKVGSAGPPAPGQSTTPSSANPQALVFVRVGLTSAQPAADAKAGAVETLVLPTFPTHAPGVPVASGTASAPPATSSSSPTGTATTGSSAAPTPLTPQSAGGKP